MAEPGLTDRIPLQLSTGGDSSAPSIPEDGRAMPGLVTKTIPSRWWLHVGLFCLTLISTTVFGYALVRSFQLAAGLDDELIVTGYRLLFHGDGRILSGLIYSLPLLLTLLAHELGHYVACRRWGVAATLPYFGPSPTLLGTIGAFIWIKSPIYRKRSLFDIGISGPIAGFVLTIPILVAGVHMSKPCPATHASFSFGAPLALRILEWWRFPGVSPGDICLHPTAMAGWAGLLATAINLLPIGQLDGGHILYAVWGKRIHAGFSLLVVAGLAIAGLFYWPWWVWAVAMFFFRRHPLIFDSERLEWRRNAIASVAVLIFVLSFSLVPVSVR